jgi:hypothetical protein
MGKGRRATTRRLGLAGAVAAVALATVGQAGAAPAVSVITNSDQKVKTVFFKGRLHSDGVLTVGQVETIVIKGMAPELGLYISVAPPDFVVPICNQSTFYCVPQPIHPYPGSRRFRTSSKGKLRATFTMPPAYELANNYDPTQSHPVQFIDQQAIHIDVEGIRFHFRRVPSVTLALAGGRAVVQVPPSS